MTVNLYTRVLNQKNNYGIFQLPLLLLLFVLAHLNLHFLSIQNTEKLFCIVLIQKIIISCYFEKRYQISITYMS